MASVGVREASKRDCAAVEEEIGLSASSKATRDSRKRTLARVLIHLEDCSHKLEIIRSSFTSLSSLDSCAGSSYESPTKGIAMFLSCSFGCWDVTGGA